MKGRRVQIAGSANSSYNIEEVQYSHNFVKSLSEKILENGGGLIVTLGEDPKHEEGNTSITFDWTVLESLKKCYDNKLVKWPKAQGAPIIAVGFGNALERIPDERKQLFDDIRETGCVELKLLNSKLNFGGLLREQQEVFGDVLITLGGGPGVNHLYQLYVNSRKHVIPTDLQLKGKNDASLSLHKEALSNHNLFFHFTKQEKALSEFSKLSLKNNPEIEKVTSNYINFLNNLRKPKAFYVRLLNQGNPQFIEVEKYFRNVVDPLIKEMGYERYEAGSNIINEGFMNVEIFKELHYSSLVVADITELRPNCLIELGYSLAMPKKTIIMAQETTHLPWDVNSIQCHKWKTDENDKTRKKNLRKFISLNINKEQLVSKQEK